MAIAENFRQKFAISCWELSEIRVFESKYVKLIYIDYIG